ncbi:MAG: amidohydrolase [Bacteroidia bacterium]|nr:MAG: amidohydrolase [Bacteroidia bacterium]
MPVTNFGYFYGGSTPTFQYIFYHNICSMRSILIFFLAFFLLSPKSAFLQTNRQTGLRENTPAVFAFINADIVTAPGEISRQSVLVIRNGIIEDVGRNAPIPADASIIDLEGKMIYPGFIDLFTSYGMADPQEEENGIYWNPQIRSHHRAADHFRPDPSGAAAMRANGFTTAHTHSAHGLLRGSGSIVSLGDDIAAGVLISKDVSHVMSFETSRELGRGYPTSAMGSVALIRQVYLDAGWYADAHRAFLANPSLERPETNLALQKLADALQNRTPVIAAARDENWFLRAAEIAEEFGINMWIRGSGHEYRRINAIKNTGLPVILPINFPEPPDVAKPEQSFQVSLEVLRHWYFAPENPARLLEAGIPFAITAYGSDNRFLRNLREAVKRGLQKDDALAALTTIPAAMLNINHLYGTIERGKAANFIVSEGELFENNNDILEVWIDGRAYVVKSPREKPAGKWNLVSMKFPEDASMEISEQNQRLRGTITIGDNSTRLEKAAFDGHRLTAKFAGDSVGLVGIYRLSAHLGGDEMLGIGENAAGTFFTWTAKRSENTNEDDEETDSEPFAELELPERFPSMEYGFPAIPAQPRHVMIRNATIWTQGPQGILENADMLVSDGHIAEVGFGLDAPRRTVEIDGSGMHVTPGLIDPHIHTSIAGGVNEVGDAITSETRITDVMHGDNVWIYRLLAGGITSATLFHGSANPIGGQNAVIKMRWGRLPGEMLIEDAAPGLKFALGENVKQMQDRYPNSRQGTEQIIRDALQAALEYEMNHERWQRTKEGIPPRRDLQLEAILEVINGERIAHVHAYRQDEMLMMMRVAEDFGFTIGSFEHTLEGYKIANELKAHGAGAVVWTDWSSFKVEAHDGILYNARLLNDVGVLTSLHSDNTQLATRMNWEAAKTMMTGVSETDAMNFITLHPAKIMGIDHRVGSLEAGKDADFVIWNAHPLSSFSIPQQTWLDGIKYFDAEEDQQLYEEVKRERALIISRIIEDAN